MIPEGYAILKEYEKGPDLLGPALVAYQCPAGVWTIGWGYTWGVREGMRITLAQAEEFLTISVARVEHDVIAACKVPANPYQLAALTLFAFNYGDWRNSTVMKCHNRGDTIGASRAFGLVVKATVNGKLVVLPGLVSRRAQEAALYLKATMPAMRTLMPQAPAPEPSVGGSAAVSGTATVAGLGGAATMLQVVNDNVQNVSGLAYSVSPLLDLMRYAPIAFGVIAIGICGYIAWRAYQRRKAGHL